MVKAKTKMPYVVGVYRGNKKLGLLRDFKGRIMRFRTKTEAQTTANIESTQMEFDGLNLKVLKKR